MFRTLHCKWMNAALLVIMALALLAGCAPSVTPQTPTETPTPKEPIIIGIAEDQSGSLAVHGRSAVMGAELAIQEWNEKGGVYGGHPIEYITRDTAGDPTKATTIAKELVNKGVVAVVGGSATTDALPMAKVLAEAQIPLMTSSTASSVRIPGPDGKIYQFQMFCTDYQMPDIIMTFCAKKGWNRLAIVNNNVSWPQGLAEICHQKAETENYKEKYGVELVGDVVCDVQSKDYAAEVTKVMDLEPDVIWGALYPPSWSVWLNSYNNLGVKTPMVTLWGLVEMAWKTLDKSLTSDIIYAFAYEQENKPLYAEKYQKLTAMSGKEPETVVWDRGYEGANDILKAIDAVGPDGAAIRDYMASDLYGEPMVLGKIDSTNRFQEGNMWDDLPFYCPLNPDDDPWLRIDEQGEKVYIKD